MVEYFNKEKGERRLFPKLESDYLDWANKNGKVAILNTRGVLVLNR